MGLPNLFRSILPPGGSSVSLVIPAISRALLFTQLAWPSTRDNITGLFLTYSSNRLAEGNALPGQST